jgi:hypothetical protein
MTKAFQKAKSRAFSFSDEERIRDQVQSEIGLGSKKAQSARDVGIAVNTKQGERQIAESSHDVMSVSGAQDGTIFTESDVSYPVQAVFDTPMMAGEGQELEGISALGSKRSNAVSAVHLNNTGFGEDNAAGNLENLLQSEPIQIYCARA